MSASWAIDALDAARAGQPVKLHKVLGALLETGDIAPEISLQDLLKRTRDDAGGCLLWRMHATTGGTPQWRLHGRLYTARRLVYEVVHGRIADGLCVVTTCECELCVHPDHLAAKKKQDYQPRTPKAANHRMAIARTKRKHSKLDIDAVRSIRASTESGPIIEARYGLKPGYASRIRANLCWVDTATPWAGLGARCA